MEEAASRQLIAAPAAYSVGNHLFRLDFPHGFLSEKELAPYAPFQIHSPSGPTPLFSLVLTPDHQEIPEPSGAMADIEDENGRMMLAACLGGGMAVSLFSPGGGECCRMAISPGYSEARAWIGGNEGQRRHAIDTALMLLYAFASAPRSTLLLHASAVECGGEAVLFLGKSGTGKSTHSQLWTAHIPGARLLNDDNPVVRIIDGDIYVYGSPWSGKTPCHIPRRLPLGAIVRLQQAHVNNISPLAGIKAYAALLPSCSCIRWDPDMAGAVHSTISRLIQRKAVYTLGCRPDREAAILCYDTLKTGSI